MQFIVSFEGKRRSVELAFGTPMDVRELLRWRASAAGRDDPHVRDAMEFRKLATKRWRYYLKGNQKVLNLSKVTDHFFVQGETMEHCRKQYRRAHGKPA